jgi:DedD protein
VIATDPASDAPLPTPDSVSLDAPNAAATKSTDVAAAPHSETKPARAHTAPEPKAPAKASPEAQRKAEKPAAAKREPKAGPVERTDDGSVALALLEGRAPPGSAAATKEPAQHGSYILQIAAYSAEKDAQSRRDRLVSSGVTNAYVQDVVSGGKAIYRLRVGPFPTHEAAQAARARLRALGYDNSFISTK